MKKQDLRNKLKEIISWVGLGAYKKSSSTIEPHVSMGGVEYKTRSWFWSCLEKAPDL